jgi:hypothetical protein
LSRDISRNRPERLLFIGPTTRTPEKWDNPLVFDYDDSTAPRAMHGAKKPGWLWAAQVLFFVSVFLCIMLELFNLPFRDQPTPALLARLDLTLPTPTCYRRKGNLKVSRYCTG